MTEILKTDNKVDNDLSTVDAESGGEVVSLRRIKNNYERRTHDYCYHGICITHDKDTLHEDSRYLNVFDETQHNYWRTIAKKAEFGMSDPAFYLYGLVFLFTAVAGIVGVALSIFLLQFSFLLLFLVGPPVLWFGVEKVVNTKKEFYAKQSEIEKIKFKKSYFKVSKVLAEHIEKFSANNLGGRNKVVLRNMLESKMLAEQSDEELTSWMESVNQIFNTDKDYPADLVPVVAVDAAEVLQKILQGKALLNHAENTLALESARDLTAHLMNESAAVKAGAMRYLGSSDSIG